MHQRGHSRAHGHIAPAQRLVVTCTSKQTLAVLEKKLPREYGVEIKVLLVPFDNPSVWQGVSVERRDYLFRIDHLRQTGAKVKFLSLEPLLGPLPNMDLRGIDWAITGGESGPGARPMNSSWVREIRDQCNRAGVPFFFKQWGGVRKKTAGRLLDGKTWDEMPRLSHQRKV